MSDPNSNIPPERWFVPVYVYDQITASDTATVLRNAGYFVDTVFRDENWPPDVQK